MSTIAETQFNSSPASSSIEVKSDDASKCIKSSHVHFNVSYQTSEFLHRMNLTQDKTFTLIESSYKHRENYPKVHVAVANISEPLEYAIHDIHCHQDCCSNQERKLPTMLRRISMQRRTIAKYISHLELGQLEH